MTSVDCRLVRKALGTLLREALEASGRPVDIVYAADGRMQYVIDGDRLSPGEAADRLGVQWRS